MIKLIRKYFRLLDRLFYTALEDLESWRNKLIVATYVLCLISVLGGNGAVVAAVVGCWTIILTFYFEKRQQSDMNGHSSNKFSKFDKESKIEEPDETFEENE